MGDAGEKKGEKQLVKPKERYSLWQYCMRLKPHLWLVLQTATMCFVNVIVLSLLARVHWTYHLHPLPRDAIVGELSLCPAYNQHQFYGSLDLSLSFSSPSPC